ncbi:MAG: alpha/beta hydrolase family protein [Ancrocorticia sp.]|uniref:alpha/beta hydrolase family protein n=1 Tax=Ancrocorticia sp. TaxID=2593684 RepID=UPI003F93626B
MDDEETISPEQPRGLRRLALRHPRLSVWIVFVLILGMWGSWAGPGWNPQPMRSLIVPETSNTSITTLADTPDLGSYDVNSEVVSLTLRDGTEIPATLRTPAGFEGLAPGMVFVHGTGTDSYKNFTREAEAISSAGIVTLVPDKRTENYTATHRDYLEMANDYEDAFEDLRGRSGVDPKRTGLYAVSEGSSIAPIVAARNTSVNYVALISAPVLPIREQGALAADSYLRNLGAPEQILSAIPKLIGQDFGEGTLEYIDFDISDYQKQMSMPVLMLYGTGDMSMPTVQGPVITREDLREGGNTDLTVRYYAEADHGLQVDGVLDMDAMQDTSDWVNGLPYTADAAPRIAGDQPQQDYMAASVSQPPWFASGEVALWGLIVGLSLTLLGALLTAIGGISFRRKKLLNFHGCGSVVHLASLSVVLAWVATVGYTLLVVALAVSYEQNRWIVQGGWLLVQLIGLVAAWMVTRVPFAWHKAHYPTDGSANHTLSGFANTIVIISFLAQATLLFTLAYWGVYPALF